MGSLSFLILSIHIECLCSFWVAYPCFEISSFFIWVLWGASCSLIQTSVCLWFPAHCDRPFLSTEKVILENQPSFQHCLLWDSSNHILEHAEVWLPKAQGCALVLHFPASSSASWLYHLIATAAKVVLIFYLQLVVLFFFINSRAFSVNCSNSYNSLSKSFYIRELSSNTSVSRSVNKLHSKVTLIKYITIFCLILTFHPLNIIHVKILGWINFCSMMITCRSFQDLTYYFPNLLGFFFFPVHTFQFYCFFQ